MLQKTLFGLSLVFLIASCSKNDPQIQPDLGFDYFPLVKGNVYQYQVDSIAFSDNTKSSDTFNFTLVLSVDSVYNFNGTDIYELSTRVKFDSTEQWQFRPSYFAYIRNAQLVINQNNKELVKLLFPVGNVKAWNGNMYQSTFAQNFELIYHQQPDENGISCKVREALNKNFIEDEERYSIYYRGKGLTGYYDKYLNTQQSGTNGHIVSWELTSITQKP